MAHTARLNDLAESLVTSITRKASNDATFKRLKDHAIKGLKNQSHARTNQFEIRDRLSGLVEKFTVLNRDDLAEALEGRLDELPSKSKWLPEVLSLLLELSDRPVEKTKLEDLEALNRPVTPPPELTWEEILADEPRSDDGVWDEVERGYHSSGDDGNVDEELEWEPTTSTNATSVDEGDYAALAKLCIVQPDLSLLDDVRLGRERFFQAKAKGETKAVSELTLVRETLAMLHGLPTDVYTVRGETGTVTFEKAYVLETAANSTVHDILVHFADLGSRLNYLRGWTRRNVEVAYIQSVQASLQRLLTKFGIALAELERRFVNPAQDTVVSIVETRAQIETLARPLLHLSNSVRQTASQSSLPPFALLDALYEGACIAQIVADDHSFWALATVLFAGVQTYIRPVKAWTATGTLPADQGGESFFVLETRIDCELNNIWHDRFALRTLADGRPCTPVFMQGFVDKAFAMGKTRAFLRLLDPTIVDAPVTTMTTQQRYDAGVADMQAQLESNPLLPFAELFAQTLRHWTEDADMECTPLVRSKLLHEHGVHRTLRALEYAYFGKDGSLLESFTDTLFSRIPRYRGTRAWSDRFTLTELAQITLGSSPAVDADNLTLFTAKKPQERDAGDKAPAVSVTRQLQTLELHHALTWPVQNITRSAALSAHIATFALLLQVSYAQCLLRPSFFTLRRRVSDRDNTAAATALELRNCLVWFTGILRSHIANTASTLHREMCERMEAADGGIDGMASVWKDYEKRLQTTLLLAPNLSPLKDAVERLLELCETFAQVMPSLAILGSSQISSSSSPRPSSADSSSLLEEFHKSLSFLTAGLRGVSRAGGETALEVLAERLEAA